jgi:hypothetical protein
MGFFKIIINIGKISFKSIGLHIFANSFKLTITSTLCINHSSRPYGGQNHKGIVPALKIISTKKYNFSLLHSIPELLSPSSKITHIFFFSQASTNEFHLLYLLLLTISSTFTNEYILFIVAKCLSHVYTINII